MLDEYGAGGGINGNFETVALTAGTDYGLGLGISLGIDMCINW